MDGAVEHVETRNYVCGAISNIASINFIIDNISHMNFAFTNFRVFHVSTDKAHLFYVERWKPGTAVQNVKRVAKKRKKKKQTIFSTDQPFTVPFFLCLASQNRSQNWMPNRLYVCELSHYS
jgi:hypothetical protein